jgi:glucose/arabinose dehydrogenase
MRTDGHTWRTLTLASTLLIAGAVLLSGQASTASSLAVAMLTGTGDGGSDQNDSQFELSLVLVTDEVEAQKPLFGFVEWGPGDASDAGEQSRFLGGLLGPADSLVAIDLDRPAGGFLVGPSFGVFGQDAETWVLELADERFTFRPVAEGGSQLDSFEGTLRGGRLVVDGIPLFFGSDIDSSGLSRPAYWMGHDLATFADSGGRVTPGEFQAASSIGTVVGSDLGGGLYVELPDLQLKRLPSSEPGVQYSISRDGLFIAGGSAIWVFDEDLGYQIFTQDHLDFTAIGQTPQFVAVETDDSGNAIFIAQVWDIQNEPSVAVWKSTGQYLGSYTGEFAGLVPIDGDWVVGVRAEEADYLVTVSGGQTVTIDALVGQPARLAGDHPLFASPTALGILLDIDQTTFVAIHSLWGDESDSLAAVDLLVDTTGDGEFDRRFQETDFAELRLVFPEPGDYEITAIATHQDVELARITQQITVLPSGLDTTPSDSDPLLATRQGNIALFGADQNQQSLLARQAMELDPSSVVPTRETSGQTTIEILAAGETGDEIVQLLVDQQVVRTWENVGGNVFTGQFVTLSHTIDRPVTAGQIRVAFTNDLYDPDNNYDRNVRVDAILVNNVRYETESPNVFSNGTWLPGIGIVPGFPESEFLHVSGYFQYADSGSFLQVRARGDEGGEQFHLRIDGSVVATYTVTKNFQAFTYQANRAISPSQVQIEFINDLWDPANNIDRNLIVDYLLIDSTTYETESPSVLSTGTWQPGIGFEPGFWQSEILHANGYFHYGQFSNQGDFSLAESTIRVPESQTDAALKIIRLNGASGPVTVDYRTVDDTAVNGRDYIGLTGRVAFADGETEKIVNIRVIDNNEIDGDRQFIFTIDNVSGNASLRPPRTATVIIEDDDKVRGEGNGLMGEYYDDLNFGNLFIARVDPQIAFDWGTGAPASGMPSDRFTVRWRGRVEPRFSELYTFVTRTDDGVRLRVNNQLIIDRWVNQAATVHTGTIALQAGVLYDIEMEYYENTGLASAELSWRSARQSQEIIPSSQLYAADPPVVAPGTRLQAETLYSGLTNPTAIEFTPDGRLMYIAEQRGIVRTVANGILLSTPFVDFRDRVNGVRDRGLLGLAVHPAFPEIPFVYLLYTYDPPEVFQQAAGTLAGPNGRGNRAGRLTRVTADVSTGYRTAVPGSEVVVLGSNSTWQNFNGFVNSTSDFNEPPAGIRPDGVNLVDFINSDSESHTIGDIKFAPDGSLFVSIGDGTSYNRVDPRTRRVQDIDNLSGKVLRIDPLTGRGLPSNPFFNGNANANRSKVFQLGLRNPFRMAVHPNTGQLYIGDVGWGQWEEVNAGPAGANFGWPWYEGGNRSNVRTNGYRDLPEAASFYASGEESMPPVLGLSHSTGINAIVLGDVYTGSTYPAQYRNNLFYNDLGRGIVSHVSFNANGSVSSVGTFATGHRLVVQIRQGPDQNLYYVDLDDGLIGRWRFID